MCIHMNTSIRMQMWVPKIILDNITVVGATLEVLSCWSA